MAYPFTFILAMEPHQEREGLWADHPRDPGKETYRGITRVFHPDWPGWARIDTHKGPHFPGNLESDKVLQDMVLEFYFQNYWKPMRLGEVRNQAIINELIDIGAGPNGIGAAGKIVQGALTLFGHPVPIDGDIGPVTIKAINEYPHPGDLVKLLNGLQFTWLLLGAGNVNEIIAMAKERLPALNAFMRGWLRRVEI